MSNFCYINGIKRFQNPLWGVSHHPGADYFRIRARPVVCVCVWFFTNCLAFRLCLHYPLYPYFTTGLFLNSKIEKSSCQTTRTFVDTCANAQMCDVKRRNIPVRKIWSNNCGGILSVCVQPFVYTSPFQQCYFGMKNTADGVHRLTVFLNAEFMSSTCTERHVARAVIKAC